MAGSLAHSCDAEACTASAAPALSVLLLRWLGPCPCTLYSLHPQGKPGGISMRKGMVAEARDGS